MNIARIKSSLDTILEREETQLQQYCGYTTKYICISDTDKISAVAQINRRSER